ncbi:hypothetical protein AVEN_84896-1 [Araneus ventricosus]|uniref:Uncharacterized protein n=1 Tax=Araneus ventricosus TaxID=182803 RepID=A0A4Y2NCE2_ARAVE|nr:hypothetical protein AVEN_84896-1 [Araneus ventricosus]
MGILNYSTDDVSIKEGNEGVYSLYKMASKNQEWYLFSYKMATKGKLLRLLNDPTRLSVCSTDQLFHLACNVSSLLSFSNRIIYLLLTMPTPFEKEMQRLHKLLAEVETDKDSDFGNEDNGPGDILEEKFYIMEVSANMIRNRKRTEILEMKK